MITRQRLARLRRCLKASSALTRQIDDLIHDLRHRRVLPEGAADARQAALEAYTLTCELAALGQD